MAKHWDYATAPGSSHGEMICTACRKPITDGQYRVRETDAAYLPQHRACCADDPKWPALDAADASRAETAHIIDELETLASELSEGQQPSRPVLLEAVRRALHPVT